MDNDEDTVDSALTIYDLLKQSRAKHHIIFEINTYLHKCIIIYVHDIIYKCHYNIR